MTPKKYYFLLFAFCISLTMCAQNRPYDLMLKGLYKNTLPFVKVADLKTELSKNPNLVLLDARETGEYNVSHLQNAKCVGYEHFDLASVKNIPQNANIVVYCSVGYRSERIGEKLKSAGYTHIRNLYGGIFDWVNAGNSVVNNQKQSTNQVHGYSKSWGVWVTKGKVVY